MNFEIVKVKENEKEKLYRLLQYNEEFDISLVEIDLKTGRHHQIRVQFASRGHALCGDQRYGKQDNKQICLYAYQLEFLHPVTKEKMSFKLYPNSIGDWTKFTL